MNRWGTRLIKDKEKIYRGGPGQIQGRLDESRKDLMDQRRDWIERVWGRINRGGQAGSIKGMLDHSERKLGLIELGPG